MENHAGRVKSLKCTCSGCCSAWAWVVCVQKEVSKACAMVQGYSYPAVPLPVPISLWLQVRDQHQQLSPEFSLLYLWAASVTVVEQNQTEQREPLAHSRSSHPELMFTSLPLA